MVDFISKGATFIAITRKNETISIYLDGTIIEYQYLSPVPIANIVPDWKIIYEKD